MSRPVAVVTGAAGGIGQATVDLFVAQGWEVVAIDIAHGDSQPARWLTVDLASEDAVASAFGEIGKWGAIDALVNNAAVSVRKPLPETAVGDWDRLMAVNLRAAFVASRLAVPLLADRGGAIVNVSSVHALATTGDAAAYAAAKAGLLGLTRAMAIELGGVGIRVNAVIPGAIDTPMLRGGSGDPSRLKGIAGRTPLGRIGQPMDVAEAILFLADSNRSSFVTGQTLVVDGGALARLSTE